MTDNKFLKPRPEVVAVFGAGGRMGREVADYLAYAASDIQLRWLASSEKGAAALRDQRPGADVRVADYFDPATLRPALEGVDSVFVVTPPGLDEQTAMTNLVEVLRDLGTTRQVIRLVGFAPEWNRNNYPCRTGGEHFIAKDIFDNSGLPVTYVNLGASLMDNLFFALGGIQKSRTLIWPDRWVPLMDVRDLGEVIARLFLNDDIRLVGSFLTINNGYDYMTTAQLAEVMSNAFRTPIACETNREAFLAEYGPIFKERFGAPDQAEILLEHFEWEHANWTWQPNTTAETILGRKPNTLHNWLVEHKAAFLGA